VANFAADSVGLLLFTFNTMYDSYDCPQVCVYARVPEGITTPTTFTTESQTTASTPMATTTTRIGSFLKCFLKIFMVDTDLIFKLIYLSNSNRNLLFESLISVSEV